MGSIETILSEKSHVTPAVLVTLIYERYSERYYYKKTFKFIYLYMNLTPVALVTWLSIEHPPIPQSVVPSAIEAQALPGASKVPGAPGTYY